MSLPPSPSARIAPIQDWDAAFAEVEQGLRMALGMPGRDAQARAQRQACLDALDRLHTVLIDVVHRQATIQEEVAEAHRALARTRAELMGAQAREQRARHRALHDSLTTLPNRGSFHERLASELGRPDTLREGCAVFYLDLDSFKAINDRHGHATGDALLRIIAARLSRAVRAQDVVGRLGGDEFACLLRGVSAREQLSHLACKLFDAVSAPITIERLTLTVRPSIGIAVGPADGSSPDELLRHADEAMYRAKHSQSGYAFWEAPLEAP